MEVKTKFNVGEEVYALNDKNKIEKSSIEKVLVFATKTDVSISYYLAGWGYSSVNEDMLFTTKEALLEYIQSE